MVGLDVEIRLANVLIAIGTGEQDVEDARQRLAQAKDFDPYQLFLLVDKKKKGYVGMSELQAFLR